MLVARTVERSDEAYRRLVARRRDDATISDMVCRLTDGRSLLELAGILDDEQADELRAVIDDRRGGEPTHRGPEQTDEGS